MLPQEGDTTSYICCWITVSRTSVCLTVNFFSYITVITCLIYFQNFCKVTVAFSQHMDIDGHRVLKGNEM